jgi:AcrR family transcriptional regulator
MSEIASEAGLTKPALYRSFPNKASLADAFAERVALDLGEQIARLVREDRPLREVVHLMIEAFCTRADESPELFRFLVHGAVGLGRTFEQRRLADAFGRLAAFALRTTMDRAGIDSSPAETWGYAVVGGILFTIDWWLTSRPIELAELIEHLTAGAWALMARAGAEDFEGPLIDPDQPQIYRTLIVGENESASG